MHTVPGNRKLMFSRPGANKDFRCAYVENKNTLINVSISDMLGLIELDQEARGVPRYIAVNADGDLLLYPMPDAVYSVRVRWVSHHED